MTTVASKFGGRKIREGTVVSDAMEKTVVVSVSSATRHPLYKKTMRRQRNYIVHDEDGDAHRGDRVRIVESAPISKTKRWRLIEVLRQVDMPSVAPEEIDLELIGEVKPKKEATPEAVSPAAVEEAPPGSAASEAPDDAAQPAEAEALEEVEPPEEVKTEEDAPPEPEAPAAAEAEAEPEETEAAAESDVADEPAGADEEKAE